MAVDMVYDILKKHNPMLACITEGHNILECSAIYQGLDFTYIENGNYKTFGSNPYYRIGHAPGKDNGVSTPPKIPHNKVHRIPRTWPVLLTNFNKNGRVTQRLIEKKPHSYMFR